MLKADDDVVEKKKIKSPFFLYLCMQTPKQAKSIQTFSERKKKFCYFRTSGLSFALHFEAFSVHPVLSNIKHSVQLPELFKN